MKTNKLPVSPLAIFAVSGVLGVAACGAPSDAANGAAITPEPSGATMPETFRALGAEHAHHWVHAGGGEIPAVAWPSGGGATPPSSPTPSPTTTPVTPSPTTTPVTPSPTTTPVTPAPTSTDTPPPPPSPPSTSMPYRGVNLSGAEFGSALPGTYGKDYTFPTHGEVDYFIAKKMTTFRVNIVWERLQTAQYAAFDAGYGGRLDDIVSYATSKGAYVIIDPHNEARYYGTLVGSSSVPNAAFADFWAKMAARYGSNPLVMFNLTNEPNTMPTEQWVSAANAAIAAVRSAGGANTVVVPGNNWTGAYSWTQSFYGTPNSVALLAISDPANNVLFEAHQYLDSDSSGGSSTCVSTTIGSQRLAPFVDWLRANGKKGILGEFAGADNATCNAALTDMMSYIATNADVLQGWVWWAGGPWWGSYMFGLDPTSSGADQPQMALLAPFL